MKEPPQIADRDGKVSTLTESKTKLENPRQSQQSDRIMSLEKEKDQSRSGMRAQEDEEDAKQDNLTHAKSVNHKNSVQFFPSPPPPPPPPDDILENEDVSEEEFNYVIAIDTSSSESEEEEEEEEDSDEEKKEQEEEQRKEGDQTQDQPAKIENPEKNDVANANLVTDFDRKVNIDAPGTIESSLVKPLPLRFDEPKQDDVKIDQVALDDEVVAEVKVDAIPTVEEYIRREIDAFEPLNDLADFGVRDVLALGWSLSQLVVSMRRNQANRYVELNHAQVSEKQAIIIANCGLYFNENMEGLSIDNSLHRKTKMNDLGARAMFESLFVNTHLISLSLIGNNIGDYAMYHLAAMLQVNTTLTELDLSNNRITATGTKPLCETLKDIPDSSLLHLSLQGNPLSDLGAAHLADALSINDTITHLNLSSCRISEVGAIDIVGALHKNHTLTSLSIEGKDLDDDGILQNIDAWGASVIALKLLDTNEAFQSLSVSGVPLPIAKLRASRWIDLSQKNLDEIDVLTCVQLLRRNVHLVDVNFSSNPRVGRWGICALCEAIAPLKTVRFIDVSNTGLFEDAGHALGDILIQTSSTLKTFKAGQFTFSVQEILGNHPTSDLTTTSTLMTPTLSFPRKALNAIDKAVLAKLLSQNYSDSTLNAWVVPLDEVIWDISNTSMEYYEFVWVFQNVERHRTLQRVDAASCELDCMGAEWLAQAMRNHLTLREVNLENNKLGTMGGTVLAEALAHNHSITYLNLSWTKLLDEGVMAFGDALKKNRTLLHLELRGNNLRSKGIYALSEGLTVNMGLKTLNLRWNMLEHRSAHALAHALRKNRVLTHLDLEQNEIGTLGAMALAQSLLKNKVFQHLNINTDRHLIDFGIEKDGALAMADLIRKTTTLTGLELGDVGITKEGCAYIIEALKENHSIQILNLSKAGMTGDQVTLLFRYLGTNTTLLDLNLQGNFTGVDGGLAAAKFIVVNQTLKELNLMDNDITEEGLIEIANAIQNASKALVRIQLRGNRVSDRTKARLLQTEPPLVINI